MPNPPRQFRSALTPFSEGTVGRVAFGAGDELILRVDSPQGEWRLGTEGSLWQLRDPDGNILASDRTPNAVRDLLDGAAVADITIDDQLLSLVITYADGKLLTIAGRDQPDSQLAMTPSWRLTAPAVHRMLLADPIRGLIERDPSLPAYLTWPALLDLQLRVLQRRETAFMRIILVCLIVLALGAVAVAVAVAISSGGVSRILSSGGAIAGGAIVAGLGFRASGLGWRRDASLRDLEDLNPPSVVDRG